MNLSGAQGISYAIRGDATQLRQALREAAADVRAFGQVIQSSLVGPAQAAAAAQAEIATAAVATAAALRAQAAAATQAGGATAASAFSAGAALGRQAAAAVAAAAATASAATTAAAANTQGAAAAAAAANTQAAASARAAAAAEGAAAAQAAAAATVAAANARVAGSAAGAAGAMNTMGASGVASLSGISGILGHLVGPLGFAALIAVIAKTGVGFNDFMARQEIAFTTMLGSASGAKEFLSDMLAFAKTTPFSFPELTASAQKMVAFGIESSKVVDIMRTLGDATVGSGGSMAELQGLGIVLGQVSAKGRLMGQELLQFAERGIPALTVLANKSNMSVADFQEKVSKGQVRSEEAITNLIDGLRDGTTGINGTTAAYDGLMAKVKESNIFSSAFDSFKSGFRTMSAELTESLTPALVAMVNIGGDAMGAVKGIAAAFNGMAGPTKSVSIAIAGVLIAGRLLGPVLQRTVGGALTSMGASLSSVAIGTRLAALRVGEFRLALSGVGGAAQSAKTALMGAFGGPWGLGIAAATGLMIAFAQSNAQAKADADALKSSLDAQTGAMTEGTSEAIAKKLQGTAGWGIFKERFSGTEAAEVLGIELGTLQAAAEGSASAMEQISAITGKNKGDLVATAAAAKAAGLTTAQYGEAVTTVENAVKGNSTSLAEAIRLKKQELRMIRESEEAKEEEVKTATQLSDQYRDAAFALHNFAEEQEKAIQSQQQIGDAAGKAFDAAFSTINGFEATVVTAEQLADARAKVTDATNSLRQAEDSQNRDSGRRKTTSADRKKSADDVAKALRNQGDAQKELSELEATNIPVGDQMMEHYRKTLEEATKFAGDIEALATAGVDPKLINDLTLLGPEAAAPQLEQLLGTSGAAMIEAANQTEEILKGMNGRVVENGRLTAIAMQSSLASTAADLPMAMKIAAAQGGQDSARAIDIAAMLGISEGEVERIAASFGQDWVKGRDEYLELNPSTVSLPGLSASEQYQKSLTPTVAVDPVAELMPGWDTSLVGGMTAYLEAQILTPNVGVKPTFSLVDQVLAFGAKVAAGTSSGTRSHGGNFALGGIYPGYTPGRDTGYIGVGGGEAIMRPEWTRAMGPNYVHTMNALARGGGVDAIRKAMAGTGYMGAFSGGGIAGGSQWSPSSAPQIIEVPVTQRVEHHGVTTIGTIVAADPMDFDRKVRQRRRGSFTGGR